MIRLIDFSIGFGPHKLLEKVEATFMKCKLTALIGRNGSGKSTLLKTICGLNENYTGDILISKENLRSIPRHKLARKIAYVNTHRPRLGNLKCKEVVALGRSPYTGWNGKLSHKDWDFVDKAIEMVGMASYGNRYFNSLSDGESQKIMIARAIAQDTEIIILDEPTSFLDLPTRFDLVEILKNLTKEKEKTIIFSTHELDIAIHISDYMAIMDNRDLIILPSGEMAQSTHLRHLLPENWDLSAIYLKESGKSFS